MYTVPLNALLEMKKIEPHEVLKARDVLVEFQKDLGHAAFVSHQWIGQLHPDPDFAQMQVLQDALKHAMSQLHQIPQDALTEVVNPMAKPLPTSQLRSKALFLWYDYFSCPQLDRMSKHFMEAVESIPAYVEECRFFLALCPVVESLSTSQLFTPSTWFERGWCRLERVCQELSEEESWIMVKGSVDLELKVGTEAFVGWGAVGEGRFTVPADKQKLLPVLRGAVKRKLLQLLRMDDFVGYRVLLNKQKVLFRGLATDEFFKPVPSNPSSSLLVDTGDPTALVAEFFHHNGFTDLPDGPWWVVASPLCCAGWRRHVDSRLVDAASRSQPEHPEGSAATGIVQVDHATGYLLFVQAS